VEGAFLLTQLLTAALSDVRNRAGEDVRRLGELVADHVGIHAQGDGRVRVAEPGGDDMRPGRWRAPRQDTAAQAGPYSPDCRSQQAFVVGQT
jgi:hypothetical protein